MTYREFIESHNGIMGNEQSNTYMFGDIRDIIPAMSDDSIIKLSDMVGNIQEAIMDITKSGTMSFTEIRAAAKDHVDSPHPDNGTVNMLKEAFNSKYENAPISFDDFMKMAADKDGRAEGAYNDVSGNREFYMKDEAIYQEDSIKSRMSDADPSTKPFDSQDINFFRIEKDDPNVELGSWYLNGGDNTTYKSDIEGNLFAVNNDLSKVEFNGPDSPYITEFKDNVEDFVRDYKDGDISEYEHLTFDDGMLSAYSDAKERGIEFEPIFDKETGEYIMNNISGEDILNAPGVENWAGPGIDKYKEEEPDKQIEKVDTDEEITKDGNGVSVADVFHKDIDRPRTDTEPRLEIDEVAQGIEDSLKDALIDQLGEEKGEAVYKDMMLEVKELKDSGAEEGAISAVIADTFKEHGVEFESTQDQIEQEGGVDTSNEEDFADPSQMEPQPKTPEYYKQKMEEAAEKKQEFPNYRRSTFVRYYELMETYYAYKADVPLHDRPVKSSDILAKYIEFSQSSLLETLLMQVIDKICEKWEDKNQDVEKPETTAATVSTDEIVKEIMTKDTGKPDALGIYENGFIEKDQRSMLTGQEKDNPMLGRFFGIDTKVPDGVSAEKYINDNEKYHKVTDYDVSVRSKEYLQDFKGRDGKIERAERDVSIVRTAVSGKDVYVVNPLGEVIYSKTQGGTVDRLPELEIPRISERVSSATGQDLESVKDMIRADAKEAFVEAMESTHPIEIETLSQKLENADTEKAEIKGLIEKLEGIVKDLPETSETLKEIQETKVGLEDKLKGIEAQEKYLEALKDYQDLKETGLSLDDKVTHLGNLEADAKGRSSLEFKATEQDKEKVEKLEQDAEKEKNDVEKEEKDKDVEEKDTASIDNQQDIEKQKDDNDIDKNEQENDQIDNKEPSDTENGIEENQQEVEKEVLDNAEQPENEQAIDKEEQDVEKDAELDKEPTQIEEDADSEAIDEATADEQEDIELDEDAEDVVREGVAHVKEDDDDAIAVAEEEGVSDTETHKTEDEEIANKVGAVDEQEDRSDEKDDKSSKEEKSDSVLDSAGQDFKEQIKDFLSGEGDISSIKDTIADKISDFKEGMNKMYEALQEFVPSDVGGMVTEVIQASFHHIVDAMAEVFGKGPSDTLEAMNNFSGELSPELQNAGITNENLTNYIDQNMEGVKAMEQEPIANINDSEVVVGQEGLQNAETGQFLQGIDSDQKADTIENAVAQDIEMTMRDIDNIDKVDVDALDGTRSEVDLNEAQVDMANDQIETDRNITETAQGFEDQMPDLEYAPEPELEAAPDYSLQQAPGLEMTSPQDNDLPSYQEPNIDYNVPQDASQNVDMDPSVI